MGYTKPGRTVTKSIWSDQYLAKIDTCMKSHEINRYTLNKILKSSIFSGSTISEHIGHIIKWLLQSMS